MNTFICYPKCSTCKKAEKWLNDKDISFEIRNIKQNNPLEEELRELHKLSGLPLRRFFNTSGMLYRELNLKDKLASMNEDEMYKLLSSDGMLVKRPIFTDGKNVLVGFKQTEWDAVLL